MRFSALMVRYLLGCTLALLPALIALIICGASAALLGGIAALSLTVAGFAAILISTRFTNSLAALERATERLANGDLSARVYPSRVPQLARLANSFNSMAAMVKGRMDALTKLSAEQDAILTSMGEGVITITSQGRVARLNDTAKSFLNVTVTDWQGRLVPEVIHHSSLQRFISSALKGEQTQSQTMTLPGTSERILQVYATPLRGAESDLGILVVLQDTTRLEQLERVRKDFVANVSHELRTPITAIKGYVETLLDGAKDDPETLAKFLAVIGRQADRLQDMFTDLLTLSQLEAEGSNARPDTVTTHAHAIIQGAIDAVHSQAHRKQAKITVSASPDSSLIANPRLMQQALSNLISNAITYSGDNPTIEVTASSDSTHVCFSVADNGPGIAKLHLGRLFERFYRVDTGRSREMGGTGLGLAIVKHIAQVHGGTVDVQSTPGLGSTFSIRVPKKRENEES